MYFKCISLIRKCVFHRMDCLLSRCCRSAMHRDPFPKRCIDKDVILFSIPKSTDCVIKSSRVPALDFFEISSMNGVRFNREYAPIRKKLQKCPARVSAICPQIENNSFFPVPSCCDLCKAPVVSFVWEKEIKPV